MDDQVQFLTSSLLTHAGIIHGWFMRYGGVSGGLFESLNGKKGSGDTDENVDENRRRAVAAITPKDSSSQLIHIVHEFKNNILKANESGEYHGYDASITDKAGLVLSQTTADCGTVIITDTLGSTVALVHGSWHTLSAKIICDVVAELKTYTNNELVAGIGPMICKNCYEYGPEAKKLFDSKYLTQSGKNYLVDLKQMIFDQLEESGITKVDDINVCTLEDQRFFSHRKDGAKSGRFLTLAGKAT